MTFTHRVRLLCIVLCLAFVPAVFAEDSAPIGAAQIVRQTRLMTLRGNWDKARTLLLAKIARAEKSGDTRSEAILRTEYARVQMDRSFFHQQDKAAVTKAIRDAQAVISKVGDARSEAAVVQLEGQLRFSEAFTNRDFEMPRTFFEKAAATRDKLGDEQGAAESLFYVGVTYDQEKRPDDALPYYRRSLAVAEKIGDKVMQSYSHRHLAGIDEDAGRLDDAQKHIELSLELRREGGFTVGVPFAMIQLADFLSQHRKAHDRAMEMLEQAIDLAEPVNSTHARFFAQLSLAQLEIQRNQPKQALSYAQCALDSAHSFNDPGDIKMAKDQIAAIQKKL